VRLLWNPQTNRVSIAVAVERSGGSLTFSVEAADAVEAFHHPFAYANPKHPNSPFVRLPHEP
jgi:hypothetical protein